MPVDSIVLSPAVAGPSHVVEEIVRVFAQHVPALSGTVGLGGGVRVKDLYEVLAPNARQYGLVVPPKRRTFAEKEIVWEARGQALAVSLQGGRADTNNGVLMAAMAAAARPDVDWLIVVLPYRYKGGATYFNVHARLGDLRETTGIRLDLAGVTLIGF